MKVFLIKDDDLDRLLAMIDRDPSHGAAGGSSQVLTQQERDAHEKAHRFFNFQIRQWIDTITRPA